LRFDGAGTVVLDRVPAPAPGPGDAVVRVEVSAICGSERGALAAGVAVNPGHEAAGVVIHAPARSGFGPGDRVGISAVRGCGACGACRAGVEVRCAAGPGVQFGMHADEVAVDVSTLRRLPDGIDTRTGVLLTGDTIGVPVRGLRRAPTQAGDRVLVVGLGPVGLGHVLVRAFLGCDVVAVEPSPFRRELALGLGASAAVAPGQAVGCPPVLVIECSGRPEAINVALRTVATGGTVLQSGECERVEISPSDLVRREVSYVASWYYATEDYPTILDLSRRNLAPERLITHEFPAAAAPEAYARFLSGESGKVLLRWAPDQADQFSS
jgi:2-desacetyl-2-hydroxyethyl bacteriochlorophyllide A dehydrogenase